MLLTHHGWAAPSPLLSLGLWPFVCVWRGVSSATQRGHFACTAAARDSRPSRAGSRSPGDRSRDAQRLADSTPSLQLCRGGGWGARRAAGTLVPRQVPPGLGTVCGAAPRGIKPHADGSKRMASFWVREGVPGFSGSQGLWSPAEGALPAKTCHLRWHQPPLSGIPSDWPAVMSQPWKGKVSPWGLGSGPGRRVQAGPAAHILLVSAFWATSNHRRFSAGDSAQVLPRVLWI